MRSERQEGTLSIPEHEKRHGGQIGQGGINCCNRRRVNGKLLMEVGLSSYDGQLGIWNCRSKPLWSVGIGGFMTQYEGDYDTVWRDL